MIPFSSSEFRVQSSSSSWLEFELLVSGPAGMHCNKLSVFSIIGCLGLVKVDIERVQAVHYIVVNTNINT